MRARGGETLVALGLVLAAHSGVLGAKEACGDEYRTCLEEARREGGTDRDIQCAQAYVECQAQQVAAR